MVPDPYRSRRFTTKNRAIHAPELILRWIMLAM